MLRLSPCSNRFLSYVKKVLHKSQMNAQQVLNAAFIQAAESPATVSSTAIVPYTGSSSSGYNHRVSAQLADGGFNGALVPSSRKRELPGTALVPSTGLGQEDGYYANLGGSYGLQFGVPGAAAGYLAGHALDSVGGLSGIGKKMKSFFGFGDYSLKSNSLIPGGRGAGRGGSVQIVSGGPRSTRIIYREYIGDVFSHPTEANSFHVSAYPLNPGDISTFKWLPPIATQYEQWTPNGIVFEFRSTSSEYVSQQALGSIIMATEYDSYDRAYSSKVEMLNSAYANEGKPSDHLLHGIECDPRDNPNSIFYVRGGPLGPSDGDIRDYDLGIFYVATQGIPHVNANLGSLYVHYDITFRKEQLYGGLLLKNELILQQTFSPPYNDSLGTITTYNNNLPTYPEDVNFPDLPWIRDSDTPVFSLPTQTAGVRWFMTIYCEGEPPTEQARAWYVVSQQGVSSVSYSVITNVDYVRTCTLFVFDQVEQIANLVLNAAQAPSGSDVKITSFSLCQVSKDFVLPGLTLVPP